MTGFFSQEETGNSKVVLFGILAYWIVGNLSTFIPNPMLPEANLAFQMVVPVIWGMVWGWQAGAIVGFFGTFGNSLIQFVQGYFNPYETVSILVHPFMGALAGFLTNYHFMLGAGSIFVGHIFNIIFYLLIGIINVAYVTSPAHLRGLISEGILGFLIVVLAYYLLKGKDYVPSSYSPPLLYRILVYSFTLAMVGAWYVKVEIVLDIMAFPVILAAFLLTPVDLLIVVLSIVVPLSTSVFRFGLTEARNEVSAILVVSLIAVVVEELVMMYKRSSIELEKRNKTISSVASVAKVLMEREKWEEKSDYICSLVAETLNISFVGIYRYFAQSRVLQRHSFWAKDGIGALPDTLSVIVDELKDPYTKAYIQDGSVREDDECNVVLVPIHARGKMWGVLLLCHEEIDSHLSQNSLESVVVIASLVSNAIEKFHNLTELRRAKDRYAMVVKGANDGIWEWDLQNDVLFLSERWYTMLGYDNKAFEPTFDNWLSLVHPDDRHRFIRLIDKHLAGRSSNLVCEIRMKHRVGAYRDILCRGVAFWADNGEPKILAGSITDITMLKSFQREIAKGAYFDQLTGLYNRIYFVAKTGSRLQNPPVGKLLAILVVDIVGFHLITETLGYETGDIILREVASRFKDITSPNDIVARIAGDRFAFLVTCNKREDVTRFVTLIKNALDKSFKVGEREFSLSVNIGIFVAEQPVSGEIALTDAEIALHIAKKNPGYSKKGFVFFSPEMRAEVEEKFVLEKDLEKVLVDPLLALEQIVLYFQPIVNISTGSIEGFEALTRWKHPKRGVVSPSIFVPLVERCNMVEKLGNIVLEKACKSIKELSSILRDNNIFISVNVHPDQLRDISFGNFVEKCLEDYSISAKFLRLEVTEQAVLVDDFVSFENLDNFNQMGIKLYLDDFGTGYSSLSYLMKYPFSVLKIDQAFIRNIDKDSLSHKIVNAIVRMANVLRLEVVAEGVEGYNQLKVVSRLGIRCGQGFFFSPPIPYDELLEKMKKRWDFSRVIC